MSETQRDRLLSEIERRIGRSFNDVIAELKNNVQFSKLVAAIESDNVDAILEAISIENAAYNPIVEDIRNAFIAGGALELSKFPKPPNAPQLIIRFDVRNVRAESWLATQSSKLIKQIVEEQREAIKIILESGMIKGNGPRTTALEIVGSINKASGLREGGVIGMTKQQAKWLSNAYDELTNGKFDDYLKRALRDKRFDRTILKLIRENGTIDKTTLTKILKSYSNRILKFRGDMIARTESLAALNAGAFEGLQQAVEKVGLTDLEVKRIWDATGDSRTRPDHLTMEGQKVNGLTAPFRAPDGSLLKHPGDSSLGATAAQTIMCRCTVKTEIDYGRFV